MQQNNLAMIVAVLAAVIILIICAMGAGFWYVTNQEDNNANTPPIATFVTPINGTQLEVNQSTVIGVSGADDTGITRIELWVDGVLTHQQAATAADGEPILALTYSWTPTVAGFHVLEVRAYDTDNQQNATTMLSVNAIETVAETVPTPTVEPPTPAPTVTPIPAPAATATPVPTTDPTTGDVVQQPASQSSGQVTQGQGGEFMALCLGINPGSGCGNGGQEGGYGDVILNVPQGQLDSDFLPNQTAPRTGWVAVEQVSYTPMIVLLQLVKTLTDKGHLTGDEPYNVFNNATPVRVRQGQGGQFTTLCLGVSPGSGCGNGIGGDNTGVFINITQDQLDTGFYPTRPEPRSGWVGR